LFAPGLRKCPNSALPDAETPRKVITWKHVNGVLAFHNRRWSIIGKLATPADYD